MANSKNANQFSVCIPKNADITLDEIDRRARDETRTRSSLVIHAIKEYFKKNDGDSVK